MDELDYSLLSRDELTYELELRDSTVSEENSTDDLVKNLQGLTLAEIDVTPLQSPAITPEAEFANCSNGVEEIAKLVKAVITRQSIPLVQVKLWHYQRRVDVMAHTAQMYSEETGELKAQLEDVSKKFARKQNSCGIPRRSKLARSAKTPRMKSCASTKVTVSRYSNGRSTSTDRHATKPPCSGSSRRWRTKWKF
jgi:hypothetical protein